MKSIFIILLLLTGIAGQAAWAEDQPADSSDTTTQPADTTQDSGGDSEASKAGKEEGKDEEPDCD